MGIVVNNAILLIDEINVQLKNPEHGDLSNVVVTAAKSRLRPILMTTAATIFGLLPLALGGGMWSSMAYAMMFGLAFATVLTLVLCPTLVFLFFRGRDKKKETPAKKEKKPTKKAEKKAPKDSPGDDPDLGDPAKA
jgi:multidrug efflux pump